MMLLISIERAENGFVLRNIDTGEVRVTEAAWAVGREVERLINAAEISRLEMNEARAAMAANFATDVRCGVQGES